MAKDKEWFKKFVQENGDKNISWRHDRIQFPCHSTDREKAFSDAWIKENEDRRGIDYGWGLLQDNFCSSLNTPDHLAYNVLHKITKRERVIVATIIQWLGTNCGWCWLNKAVNNAGYRIVKIKDEKENTME